MALRPLGLMDFNHFERARLDSRVPHSDGDVAENIQYIDLHEELGNAADEMADILSVFGRFSRTGRKNNSTEDDFASSILEEKLDEKLDSLIKQVTKLRDISSLLNFARSLFPNDSDLMLALRELLFNRQLSELQKNKLRESITELEKFADLQKLNSGINIGRLAKRFSNGKGTKKLSARSLRSSYLRFLEQEVSAGFIYQDWIDEYGCENRKRLLSFTMSALVADMKANEPGIQVAEFGPLSSKLLDARVLNTLDRSLLDSFADFTFREQMKNQQRALDEEHIVKLYMTALTDFENLKSALKAFSDDFMSNLLIRQRAAVLQMLKNMFNMTPDYLYADAGYRNIVLDFMSSTMLLISDKEKKTGVWKEYYI
ncbi:type III secretion system gatekeeper subunit SctW [Erwinia piriflorinigrans]|uniref:Protein mxiC n=1 Tax=Erwinia piriflorinigrans CFBP 5888 TaxID=1161919 RepID=V5Z5D1_9GAMM|nr:type III secretion system gatekeeper subunit SctW [Erwinia piriflorinigrans]CCG86225.1 Protein mxiC [Erwinia piriflorinigrans CFBP 5888]